MPLSRTLVTGGLLAALMTSTAVLAGPSGAAQPAAQPDVDPNAYANLIMPPEVSPSPLSRRVSISMGALDRMYEAISRDLGAPSPPQRQLLVGVWNGQECTNRQGEGRRSWTYADNFSKGYAESLNWANPAETIRLNLYRGAGSAYPAGAQLCAVERVRWTTAVVNDTLRVVYSTTSQPGVASQAVPELPLTAGTTYRNVLPAPTVGPVPDSRIMRITNPSLASIGDALSNDGFGEALIQSRQLWVGARGPDEACEFQVRPPDQWEYVGPRGRKFEDIKNWGAGSWVLIGLGENLRGTLVPGVTPCVVQRVTFRYADRNGSYTLVSKPGFADNAIPGPSIAEVDLTDIDPGSGDIVLEDFDLPGDDSPSLQLGTVPSLLANADVIRASLDRVRDLVDLLTTQLPGQGANPPVGLEPRQFPDIVPELDANAQGVVQQAQAAATQAEASLNAADAAARQTPEYAELAQGVEQLQSAVSSVTATVPIAGGSVPVPYLGAAARVNLANAPITGLKGVAKLGATTLTVKAPSSVKRGEQGVVKVTVKPASAKGRVAFSIVRKVPTGIQVITTASAPLRKGKATARLKIPKAAPKSGYSVVASYLSTSGTAAGVSAIRPVKVR